jgi:hypothetical protein
MFCARHAQEESSLTISGVVPMTRASPQQGRGHYLSRKFAFQNLRRPPVNECERERSQSANRGRCQKVVSRLKLAGSNVRSFVLDVEHGGLAQLFDSGQQLMRVIFKDSFNPV